MHCFCSQWITHCMILLQFRYSHIYIIVSVSPLSLLDFNEKWEKLFSGCFPALQSAFMHAKQRAIHNKSPSRHVANGLTRHDKHPLLYPTPHAALLPSLFCPDLPGYIIAEIPLDYLFIYGVVSSGGGGCPTNFLPHFISAFYCQRCHSILFSMVDPNNHAASAPPPDFLSKHITGASLSIVSYSSLRHQTFCS